MKKLFIFASSMVMASMIYSADDGKVTLYVKTLMQKGLDRPSGLAKRLDLQVNLQKDTVQDLIDRINEHYAVDGLSVGKLLFGGKDLALQPTELLGNFIRYPKEDVHAILTDQDITGYNIKG